MIIREVVYGDLSELLDLYTYLHDNKKPIINEAIKELWHSILNDVNHHILVALTEKKIVSSCALTIVPNLTHEQRPYGLIENVITHPEHRNKGYAKQILNHAKTIAINNRCYKIMLMTGSKKDSTMRFYEQAGYNRIDKTAFIQWL